MSAVDEIRRRLLQGALLAPHLGAVAPLFVRHARAAEVDRFALGVASGSPRHDRLVLWTRVTGSELPERIDVDWELAEDEAFTRIAARGRERALADDASTVHAEPTGLAPDRWYWYRFTALGARSAVGRTRTAPAPGAAVDRLRFAIASCQRWDHGQYAAWGEVAQRPLDLVLFLGDYIYEYAGHAGAGARATGPARRHAGGLCRTLADYRARYAQYKSDPLLQAAHASAPWIVIWDDHETDNDWAGDQAQTLEADFARRRAAAAKAYWEHMPLPKALRPSVDSAEIRLYQRYDWGRLARLIMLDDRQWRDPQVCPKPGRGGSNTVTEAECPALLDPRRTLLGAAQEEWLAQSWDPARRWNLLGQQTLMAPLQWREPSEEASRYWTDGWDGYRGARARLLGDLAARKVANAVVLGGDVHANVISELRVRPEESDSPVLASEFCGTSISSRGLGQRWIDRALPLNPHVRYGGSDENGFMSFELRADRLEVELRRVVSIWDAGSPLETAARFAVEAGRPGPQRA